MNPFGTVPCIYYHGRAIFESAICAEWVDEQFPTGTKIFPTDPTDRATVRLITGRFGEKVLGPLYGWVRNRDPAVDQERREKFVKELKAFHDLYAEHASKNGPYFLGDEFSYAETAIMPFLYRFELVLRDAKGFELFAPENGLQRLKQALDAVKSRPAFQKTCPTPEYVLQTYSQYYDPVPSCFAKHKSTIVTALVTAVATAGVAALVFARLKQF